MIPWSEKREQKAVERGWEFSPETQHEGKTIRLARWTGCEVALMTAVIEKNEEAWQINNEAAALFEASDQELRIRGLEFSVLRMQHALATMLGAGRQDPSKRIILPNGGI